MTASRPSDRAADELRDTTFELGTAPFAEGSCVISMGATRVLCTATVEDGVPPFREGIGGWVTGEYAMLPRATQRRTSRERRGARGRTQEIQRLIGRSLRSVTDMSALGPRTVLLDCDVLQADGGTRTASITGAYVALALACRSLRDAGGISAAPLMEAVAAVSVGIVGGTPLLDLNYEEDSSAQVDMNVVGTAAGHLIEVQGTAEGDPFSRSELDQLVDLAQDGIRQLIQAQEKVLQAAV